MTEDRRPSTDDVGGLTAAGPHSPRDRQPRRISTDFKIGELLIGVALIVAGLIWLLRWERLRAHQRDAVLLLIAASAIAGILMNISFHLANGSPHPWLIPRTGFDEGVDLDSLMPFIQLVFAAVSLKLWAALRRERRLTGATAATNRHDHGAAKA